MKQKITNFFLRKRFKKLRNNRGFSLLEVLVAVSIIGIISAIAIPGFQNYRKNAATVAGETSIRNIYSSYQNCIVLKQFNECDSIADLGVTCSDCTEDNTTGKFCVSITKSVGGDDFKACISIDSTTSPHTTLKTYGGSLMTGAKICHQEKSTDSGTTWATDVSFGLKNCNVKADCGFSETLTGTNQTRGKCEPTSQSGVCGSNICT